MKHATCSTPILLYLDAFLMTLKNMYMQIFKYKKQYQYINTIGKIVPCFNVSHDVFQYALYMKVKYDS